MTIVTVKATVKIPTVPNFLISDGDMKFPLSAFTDEGLREIAAEWTKNLIENANRQRREMAASKS